MHQNDIAAPNFLHGDVLPLIGPPHGCSFRQQFEQVFDGAPSTTYRQRFQFFRD